MRPRASGVRRMGDAAPLVGLDVVHEPREPRAVDVARRRRVLAHHARRVRAVAAQAEGAQRGDPPRPPLVDAAVAVRVELVEGGVDLVARRGAGAAAATAAAIAAGSPTTRALGPGGCARPSRAAQTLARRGCRCHRRRTAGGPRRRLWRRRRCRAAVARQAARPRRSCGRRSCRRPRTPCAHPHPRGHCHPTTPGAARVCRRRRTGRAGRRRGRAPAPRERRLSRYARPRSGSASSDPRAMRAAVCSG